MLAFPAAIRIYVAIQPVDMSVPRRDNHGGVHHDKSGGWSR